MLNDKNSDKNSNVMISKEMFERELEAIRAPSDGRASEGELCYSDDTAILGSSVDVGKRTVPNRLVCQAMEGCDGEADGEPGELTFRRYRRLAEGGAGMIWFEATSCAENGRANPRQLMLTDRNIDSFKRIVDEIKSTAMKENGIEPTVILQATHSGRYSKPHGVPEPIIAYNNPLFEGNSPIAKERIVTDDELDDIKGKLVSLACRAERAGFDGVDIKCCHRYLNSELLSAYTRQNSRYGGSYENRTRLLRETVRGARESCGDDFIVTTRLNVYDGFPYPYGFGVSAETEGTSGTPTPDLSEASRLISELHAGGMPLINITMGNPYVNPHVNRPFSRGGYAPDEHPLVGVARVLNGTAELQKANPGIKMISSALSFLGTVAPNVAAAYIENGGFSFAGFGRMTFAYPDFARRILSGDGLDAKKICVACSKCTELMRQGSTPGCVIRDELYRKLYASLSEKR